MNELTLSKTELKTINPLLDFTDDTAYVAVSTFLNDELGNPEKRIIIITSNRELYIWDNKALIEKGIYSSSESPGNMLESRWSTKSLENYIKGNTSINTVDVYCRIHNYLEKYVGLSDIEYSIVTLWIMGSYLRPLFNAYPILGLIANYESGKSRALELISFLAFNGKKVGQITPASFRRYSDSLRPTLLIDELEELGLEENSPMEPILLNAFQSSEALISDSKSNGGGWKPTLFKTLSSIGIGNINGVRNEALLSRMITIPMQYNSNYKDILVPKTIDDEVCEIRDALYCWFLERWQEVRNEYQTIPSNDGLSSREWDAYKPLVAIAKLVDEFCWRLIIKHALDCKQKKLITKRANDNRLELLYFIKAQFNDGQKECSISNKDLTLRFNDHIGGRTSYKDFADKVGRLDILMDVKNHHGIKVYYFDLERINQQIELIEAKS